MITLNIVTLEKNVFQKHALLIIMIIERVFLFSRIEGWGNDAKRYDSCILFKATRNDS